MFVAVLASGGLVLQRFISSDSSSLVLGDPEIPDFLS